jgi:preprotein translocase subunit SecF
MIVVSIVAIVMGLNYGIDFRGGQEFVFEFEEPVDVVEIRELNWLSRWAPFPKSNFSVPTVKFCSVSTAKKT